MQRLNIGNEEGSGEFKRLIFKILKDWYWFIASLCVAMVVVYLIDRYTTRIYPVSASILIKENTQETEGSAVELLYGNQIFNNSRNLTNESIILRSTPLIQNTIKALNFNKTFYAEGQFKISEIYGNLPLDIEVDTTSSRIPYNKSYQITFEDDESFKVFIDENNSSVNINGTYKFGETVNHKGFKFRAIKNGDHSVVELKNKFYQFKIQDTESLTKTYQKRLKVKPTSRESSILDLSINGEIPQKEIDFLTKLMEIYIEKGLEEKNRNATNTIAFIDEQLQLISDSLSLTEDQLEIFKETNQTIDISQEATRLYNRLSELETQKVQLLVKQRYYDYLTDYFKYDDENYDDIIIPANFGIDDPVLNVLIGEIVKLQIEMNQLSVEGNQSNPFEKMLGKKKNDLKEKILENISTLKETSSTDITSLDLRIGEVEGRLRSLPKKERSFIDIKRIYDFNESLYLLLMEKRAEAAISKASTTSDVLVVNPPQLAGGSIQPQTQRNIIVGIFISMIFPVLLIYFREFFNDKILYKEDIDHLTEIPFLGVIGHKKYDDNLVVKKSPKSAVAESFRTIRSNIEFFTSDKSHKVILITSSISAEGKTFTAINLATVFGLSGKKTLLIGADLRKPKLFADFGSFNNVGLSNYLINGADLDEVIQNTNIEGLDLITSGPLPPNPSELLMKSKFKNLMAKLQEEYNYIIMDTPPIGLVTDAMILMEYADHSIYVVRQNYTPKGTIKNTQELYNSKKIKNISILFNDVKVQKYGYGYGYGQNYGYGYGYYGDEKERKGWWKLGRSKK